GKVNFARGRFHGEEQVQGHQALLRPDLEGGEIDGSEHVPVRLDKGLPGRVLLASWRWFDAVPAQDVGNGGAGNDVPQVGQRALDARVTPTGIVARQAHHEIPDVNVDRRLPGPALPPT